MKDEYSLEERLAIVYNPLNMSSPIEIHLDKVTKTYKNGFQALKGISLDIYKGEIFALLGPNGAGKTTIINIIAGLTRKTSGEVLVQGKDVEKDYRFTRSKIGLVQQEVNTDFFLKIFEVIKYQGGYYGKTDLDARVEEILKKLHFWDKKDQPGRFLSGGMKRRIMIAKALIHDPEIIFLDEPTAGVDVELRADLWDTIREMKSLGKTIILTTHYLEEAEDLADRIGIISGGELQLVEDKKTLMQRYGTKLQDIYLEVIQKGVK